ncbi:hypothetical protein AAC387_Pa08g1407 [Persea americana]
MNRAGGLGIEEGSDSESSAVAASSKYVASFRALLLSGSLLRRSSMLLRGVGNATPLVVGKGEWDWREAAR